MTGATLYDADVDLTLDKMLEAAVPPPACEWQGREGDAPHGIPADWLLSLSCGHSYYYCAEHRELVDAQLPPRAGAVAEFCDETERAPRHGHLVRVSHVWSEVPR